MTGASFVMAGGRTVCRLLVNICHLAVRQFSRLSCHLSHATSAHRHERLHREPCRQRPVYNTRQHTVQRRPTSDDRLDVRTVHMWAGQFRADRLRLRLDVDDDGDRGRSLRRHRSSSPSKNVRPLWTRYRRRRVDSGVCTVVTVRHLRTGID